MHDKFKDRLSKIYIERLLKSGNVAAKGWAERFLNQTDIKDIAQNVIVLLKRRGFKIPE